MCNLHVASMFSSDRFLFSSLQHQQFITRRRNKNNRPPCRAPCPACHANSLGARGRMLVMKRMATRAMNWLTLTVFLVITHELTLKIIGKSTSPPVRDGIEVLLLAHLLRIAQYVMPPYLLRRVGRCLAPTCGLPAWVIIPDILCDL